MASLTKAITTGAGQVNRAAKNVHRQASSVAHKPIPKKTGVFGKPQSLINKKEDELTAPILNKRIF